MSTCLSVCLSVRSHISTKSSTITGPRDAFCSLAVLDGRVGHTMDVLSSFIFVLCHSDWLFYGESCPRIDDVHPGALVVCNNNDSSLHRFRDTTTFRVLKLLATCAFWFIIMWRPKHIADVSIHFPTYGSYKVFKQRVTFKVIQGHWQWCQYICYIQLSVSLLLHLCLYL